MRIQYTLLAKSWLLALLCVSATALAQSDAVPSELDGSTQAIRELYSDYNKSRFAVQFPVTPAAVLSLQPRMNRFWYLLLHAKHTEISGQPALLRFGFFQTRAEAEQFVEEYGGVLRGLNVVAVSADEHRAILRADVARNADQLAWYWLSPDEPVTKASVQVLLDQAKELYVDHQYQQAINYYAALSLSADERTARWAQELMALSYERLGDQHRAITIYRHLLNRTPESTAATRIAQRLRAVETAASDGQGALRIANRQKQKPLLRGMVGQTYRYLTRSGNNAPEKDVLSIVATHFDIYANANQGAHEFEARLNGHYLSDLMDEDRYTRNYAKRFYLDYTHATSGLNVTAGRQKDFRTGVYTAFDGLSVKYPLFDKLSVGVSVGEPALFADVYDDLDREFFSVQASYDVNELWRLTAYYTEQTLFETTDRKAYGGEVRYTAESLSGYLNVDYDYEFAEFNNVLLGMTYRTEDMSSVSATYGRQRSPFLTSTNILLGQPFLNVEEYLESEWNRDNLLHRALRRTSLSEFATLNYSRKLDENLDISFDFYRSIMSEMPTFAPDVGLETEVIDNEAEYQYTTGGVQLIANDFLGFDDVATLALRTSDSSQSSSNWLQLSERFRFFNSKVFITPKIYIGYTQRKSNQHTYSRLRGSLALKYKPFRNIELFVEVGNERHNDLELKHRLESQYLFAGFTARF